MAHRRFRVSLVRLHILPDSGTANNAETIRVYLDLWLVNTLFAYALGGLEGHPEGTRALQKNRLVRSPQRGRQRRPRCGERTVILGRLRLPNPLLLENKSR